ncbi:MAG: HAD family hydrolase [Verrucomicrobiales bacterium]
MCKAAQVGRWRAPLHPHPLRFIKDHAFIFDLDGTLIDSLGDLADSMNAVLAANGFPEHGPDAYRYFIGDGMRELVSRALPASERGEAALERYAAQYRAEYGRRWNARTRAFDGVMPALRALADRGAKLAVLSNKPQDFTAQCVAELLGGVEFAEVRGQREGVPRKPDPAAALAIAAACGADPAETFFVGDTSVDMQTAVNAGMVPVGVLWGFRPEAELRESGARVLLREPEAIARLGA